MHLVGLLYIMDICHWGECLAVTGRIRDIGQNVLQYSFETGCDSSPSYCHVFFLTAFFEKTFISKIVIILYINYIIIIRFNNNNEVINNNCARLKEFILVFKISSSTRKDFCETYRKYVHAAS